MSQMTSSGSATMPAPTMAKTATYPQSSSIPVPLCRAGGPWIILSRSGASFLQRRRGARSFGRHRREELQEDGGDLAGIVADQFLLADHVLRDRAHPKRADRVDVGLDRLAALAGVARQELLVAGTAGIDQHIVEEAASPLLQQHPGMVGGAEPPRLPVLGHHVAHVDFERMGSPRG